MNGNFQTQVNVNPAPAVAGNFASANPRAAVLSGPGAFIAGAAGVNVGKFAWIATDGITADSFGTATAAPAGFVANELQASITTWLDGATMIIPQGRPITLFGQGDFWAKNDGSSTSARGDNVYARYSDGAITLGSAAPGAAATGLMGSTNTAAIGSTSTGTASGVNLTLSTLTGYVSIGDTVSGTGVPAGTTIISQTSGTTGLAGVYVTSQVTTASAATITTYGTKLIISSTTGLVSIGDTVSGGAGFPVGATVLNQVSGTTGGAGTYTLSAPATAYVASATGVTTFGNVLDITAVASGSLAVGDAVSGSGVPSGAVIASQTSGTAGLTGIYTLSLRATAYAASTSITVVGGVAVTGWTAQSVAAPGELVKISTWG